ncbi:MAG: sigma-54 dependent transcriptional regulator [Candidatus Eisenbacteria bacterium]
MSGEKNRVDESVRLLVVDDEESIRISLSEALRDACTCVSTAIGGEEAMAILAREDVDLVLLDLRLSQTQEDGLEVLKRIKQEYPTVTVIMMTAYGKFESAVAASQLGCYQYIAKPLDLHQLRLLIQNALSTMALSREVRRLRAQQRRAFAVPDVVGNSPRIQQLLENVTKVARSPTATVLVRGETGVGKEWVAQRIHDLSPVAAGPFIDICCSAMPDHLLETELFGHERGAFTDAKATKEGLFELADGGTLFLDEIAEMDAKLQAKLLRVLETRTFRRVGGTRDIHVNVRFVAATNRDLFAEVEGGRFREDLYYRLTVVPLYVPALRERKEDIPLLAKTFLDAFRRDIGRRIVGIDDAALQLLIDYPWPGNVRELKNTMEHLVLMGNGPTISAEDVAAQLRAGRGGPRKPGSSAELFRPGHVPTLDEVERVAILHALDEVNGNRTRAAGLLGISRQTLRAKIVKYGIAAEGEEVPAEELEANS